ncbi:MAG: hypothetical protein QOD29_3252 [Alphaproteobacteria bacterium]|nr:hypothetical protein [Alphaproteobacteria bacterium]
MRLSRTVNLTASPSMMQDRGRSRAQSLDDQGEARRQIVARTAIEPNPLPYATFSRADLVVAHGADYPLPTLLDHLAATGCQRVGNHGTGAGVYYVNLID